MDKQKFNQPEMNITPVNEIDIIRTSGGGTGGNDIVLPEDEW